MALLFIDKVPNNKDAFEQGIKDIAWRLGIDPNWLMFVIDLETAGTFSPSIQNPGSKATGLIQFVPSTATDLGTTIDKLKNMSNVEQLVYVEKYLKQKAKDYNIRNSYVDLYASVLYPTAVGQGDSYQFPNWVATSNPLFDLNKDGRLNEAEFKKALENRVYQRVPSQFYDSFFEKKTLFTSIKEKSLQAA